MLQKLFALTCTLAVLSGAGCGPPGEKPAATAPVKGTVTLGGQPMPSGEVVFSTPTEPAKTIPVTNGAFTGEAFVGKNKVQVNSYKEGPPLPTDLTKAPTKQNIVADQFSAQSTLSAEVTAAGANEFKFDVTAK